MNKTELKSKWKDKTPGERRAKLNELGAIGEKSEAEQREHDVLATLVAEDEEAPLKEDSNG